MDTADKVRLTAPCGLDCFGCELYADNVTEELKALVAVRRGVEPSAVSCRGCREQEGRCLVVGACPTYACVTAKGLAYCFECGEFPCSKLCPSREGAFAFPHNVKLFNLCRMKAVGVERWAAQEAAVVRRRYFKGSFRPGLGAVLDGET
jgi:hypothetical protein